MLTIRAQDKPEVWTKMQLTRYKRDDNLIVFNARWYIKHVEYGHFPINGMGEVSAQNDNDNERQWIIWN